MPRDIDDRKKRKALRKIRKAALLAEQGLGPPLSDWEKQFLDEVEERIETYGSAFHDLEKGASDEALSSLQHVKLREIEKKARGKSKSGFGSKGGFKRKPTPRVRQIDELEESVDLEAPEAKPKLVSARDLSPEELRDRTKKNADRKRPNLRVIDGRSHKD